MKLAYIGSRMGVVAENDADLKVLVDLINRRESAPQHVHTKRKYKKHNPLKACQYCGKMMKAKTGLKLHEVRFCTKRPSRYVSTYRGEDLTKKALAEF